MAYGYGDDRKQMMLFPESIDQYISPDHAVLGCVMVRARRHRGGSPEDLVCSRQPDIVHGFV